MHGDLAAALDARHWDAARRILAELARRETQGREAYRSAPSAATSEDFVAGEEALLAIQRGDAAGAYYRLTDRRRGPVGDVTLLLLEALVRALRAEGQLVLAAAACAEAPAAELDDELDRILLELRIDRFALDERVARASLRYWQDQVESEPDDAVGWVCLGLHARTIGDHRLAQTAAERALELDPVLADPHLILAELHEERGDVSTALSVLEAGAERTGDPAIVCALGEVLERSGDLAGARRAFERVLESDLDQLAALEGLRRVLAEQEDWDALAAHLTKMIELSADLDHVEVLTRELHRISIEHLGLGDRVIEDRRDAAEAREKALHEYDARLAEGLMRAPPEPPSAETGSPRWVLAGILMALILLGIYAALAER